MHKMWEPTFKDWSEDKVFMSSCELPTHSTSRNEYGVILQTGDGEEPYAGEAAIFWTDEMHLYLRYDWETWYRISTDDPDNCSNICKRHTATLLRCTTSSMKHHAVKVYHIDRLPEELFGRQSAADGEEKSVDNEIQSAVDSAIAKYGGRVWSRWKMGDGKLYNFDFAQIGKKFYTIVYADLGGDWLADEEASGDEVPLWFSEHAYQASPVFQAMKCRAFFEKELPQITVEALVVLPEAVNITNAENLQRHWCEVCKTNVAKTKRTGETTLPELDELLASQPEVDIEVPEIDAAQLIDLSNRFKIYTENWPAKK